jgi:outer membrane protein TolC
MRTQTQILLLAPILLGCALFPTGCRTPAEHSAKADRTAYRIVDDTRQALDGDVDTSEPLRIETAALTLRRRLIEMQMLPAHSAATLGSAELESPPHWPTFPAASAAETNGVPLRWADDGTIEITLLDAIQIAARNRHDYQSKKEDVFRAALDLDLERNAYRTTINGSLDSTLSSDSSGDETVEGSKTSLSTKASKTLASGFALSGALAVDVVKLLTGDKESAWGFSADASITIPLLRGAGKHIARESLTQAERNVIYAIYALEDLKRDLAVSVAREFLGVLQSYDGAYNASRNYATLAASAERARAMAKSGRLPEIQVDQAHQDQLRAYDRTEVARQSAEEAIDQFKVSLGLPPDASIVLARDTFTDLVRKASDPAHLNAPIPDERDAIVMALENRLDLRTAVGSVVDAQRAVVIAADNLRGEVSLFGSASTGSRRSLGSASQGDADLEFSKGLLSSVLSIDLPIERTAERNAFRKQIIDFEQRIRNAQQTEDSIKLQVRSRLRGLKQSRESIATQLEAVRLAERRQRSTDLFLKAGRAEMRDLLDAEEALLSVRNALTAAIVTYRIAELQLQRDIGVLRVTDSGLMRESPVTEVKREDADAPEAEGSGAGSDADMLTNTKDSDHE